MPTAKQISAIQPGDTIKFKAATRTNYRAVWRKVWSISSVDGDPRRRGRPLVSYHGWRRCFAVRDDEILEIRKASHD